MTAAFASEAAVFWSAFLSATFLPGASELVLAASLAERSADPFVLIGLATLGNTLGSLVNWVCGRFLIAFQDRRWFPVPPRQIDRFTAFFQRWGIWSLLLAWAPIIGDVLTVIAGIARVSVPAFLVLVGFGKLARYLAVAAGVLSWPWV
ncbi:DedA family protein [Jiella sp. MQZ9-1]|uniref:DedA family protein n=1 Tax=Jiella flava TaxID=2816857 RepID=A0A939JV84_9HYPH|nr:YqaA family protein [Jiella flava]MBO0663935.1 DedA family protein [Jiella flava]MCD2472507.1 DedA family protein [Jiella flava]